MLWRECLARASEPATPSVPSPIVLSASRATAVEARRLRGRRIIATASLVGASVAVREQEVPS
jgi:hypothetical protein